MKSIATLTMNPTIDVSYEVERVFHTHKMRTANERYAPGGGGINVARVFIRLGGTARCYYVSGGATGPALDGLLDLHGLDRQRISIGEPTRMATAVLERETGKEFRFTPQGPELTGSECEECLGKLAEAPCDMLVMSGSLPRGVPVDFYARASRLMRERGIDCIIDSSGNALRAALAGGEFLLAKPSLGELQQLVGRELADMDSIADAAMGVVETGHVRHLAVTMGHRGAMLAGTTGVVFLPALPVEAKSAVGAGDSFLAGAVHALASGKDPVEAFRFGIAAGSAAVLTPGTDLAFPEDIHRLLHSVGTPLAMSA